MPPFMTKQKKIMIFYDKHGNVTKILVDPLPTWDDFDRLVSFIETNYSAKILYKGEGPDARICKLEIDNKNFSLAHDDMFGNYLCDITESNLELLKTIAHDIENRLVTTGSLD